MTTELNGKQDDDAVTEDGVGLEELRASLGDLVLRAGFGNEVIVITRHGKQIAGLVGMKDVERLRNLDAATIAASAA